MTADSARDWPRLVARVAFAGFLLSVLFGLLLPVYTDEVGWRMQLRAGMDGGVDRMLSDICGPNTIAAPPWFMMPFRLASAWLNSAFPDPLYVRLVGVACALAWAFMLRTLIARLAGDAQRRDILTALTFGLLGLGVLPVMLVMSRPDQAVLLAVTAAILAVVISIRAKAAWPWPVIVLACGVAAISFHLKGILFAPLFLICLFFAGRDRIALRLRLALMLVLAALSLQAASYWSARFQCPGDAVLAGELAKQNLASAMAAGDTWQELAARAVRGADPNGYIVLAEARRWPMSNWLPYGRIDPAGSALRHVPMKLAWNLALLLAAACLIRALQLRWRERRLDFAVVAAPAIAGLIVVWGISQLTKNDYEAMVVLPMLAIFVVLALAAVPWPQRRARQLAVAAAVLTAISLVLQADIVRRYYPPLAAAAARPGIVAGQGFSVSAHGYGAIREQIRSTARQCGIGLKGRAFKPLLDDTTYFAMMDSWRPFHVLGVLDKWNGSIRDPLAYLKTQGSEGLIVGCRLLTPAAQARGIRNGDYCCISAK